MIVAHNLTAQNAQRQYNIITDRKKKNVEKLSSGFRINRAADDAAGLAISEKMRWQIRGLTRASQNIQDGISFVQIAEGGLQELHSICQRARELCVQAANDTNTDEDRRHIQDEIDELANETGRITTDSMFNTKAIWDVAYIPDISGTPIQAKLWATEVSDPAGKPTYGGINWADKRYTWDEIGLSGIYQNGVFKKGEYTASIPAGTLNSDDTFTPAGTASMKVTVPENSETPNLIFHRSWSADDSGITLDGIKYGWDQLEDENHVKGNFDVNNIVPGTTWSFNDLNDEHIAFTIDEGDDTLADVIRGINGDTLDELVWTSSIRSVSNAGAVSALHAGDRQNKSDTYTIDSSNYDFIAPSYKIKADNDGISVITNDGRNQNLGTESWADLGLFDDVSRFDIKHKYTSHGFYDSAAPDTHTDFVSPDHMTAGSTVGDAGYNSTVKGADSDVSLINLQFTLAEEASKDEVIEGLNNAQVITATATSSQNVAFSTTSDNSPHVTLDALGSAKINDMDFYAERILGSTFTSGSQFATGTMSADGNNLKLTLAGSSSNLELNCSNYSVSSLKNDIRTKIDMKDSNGNPLNNSSYININFVNYGQVRFSYKIDSITSAENDALRTQADTRAVNELTPAAESYAEGKIKLDALDALLATATSTVDSQIADEAAQAAANGDISYTAPTTEERQTRINTEYANISDENSHEYQTELANQRTLGFDTYKQEYIEPRKASISNGYYNAAYSSKVDDLVEAAYNEIISGKADYSHNRASVTVREGALSMPSGSGTAPHANFKTDVKYYRDLKIQSGALAFQPINIRYRALNKGIIGLNKIDVSNFESAGRGILACDDAIDLISTERANFGAYQNRLEHAMAINDYTAENTQAAESRLRDTDMAKESVENAKHDILLQAGQAMIAQANQSKQGILTLLQ